jgi:DNA repair protein RadC
MDLAIGLLDIFEHLRNSYPKSCYYRPSQKTEEAGEVLGIAALDHIIIGDGS